MFQFIVGLKVGCRFLDISGYFDGHIGIGWPRSGGKDVDTKIDRGFRLAIFEELLV